MGVTHTFVSAIADDPSAAAAGQILPSHWNATHTVTVDLASEVTGTLPVANGGTGTTTPSLVAGTNVTITGTWPNQTIAASGGGGGTPGGVSGDIQYNNAGAFGGITPGTGVSTALTQNVTGSGGFVLATSPTLTTPNLGTPTALTLTNATGLPLSTGVTGTLPVASGGTGTTTPSLVAGTNVTITGSWPNQTINAAAGSSGVVVNTTTITGGTSGRVLYDNAGTVGEKAVTGSGDVVLATSPTLVTPALGTPSSATLTNATGLPVSTGISGLGSGVATFLATPSSANLAAAVTDETGSGLLVFATSPTLTTPNLGTPSALTLTNATGLPVGGISATGTPSSTTYLRGDGSWQTVSGGSGDITIGTTVINSGTSGRILYDNSGVVGEKAVTGSGDVVLATSPTLVTPALGTPTALTLTNATGLPVGGISATGTPSSTTYLRGDGTWSTVSGGGGSPGGSSGQLQYNNAGTFDGSYLWQGTNLIEQRNGTNAQTLSVYATYTDASNYERTTISSATYSGGLYQRVRAETAGTGGDNIGLVLSSAGTGAFMLDMPDGTATGGNARGNYAVDLQNFRGAASQVASGASSFCAGDSNTASNQGAVALGVYNFATGANSFATGNVASASGTSAAAIGSNNTASGANSAAIGGQYNTASGQSAIVLGEISTASGPISHAFGSRAVSNKRAQFAFGFDRFANNGDAQWSVIGMRIATTDATATEMLVTGSAGLRATISASTTWMADINVVARSSGGTDNACFKRRCIIKRDGANNTALAGSVQTVDTDIGSNSGSPPTGWAVTVTADDTNEALKIEVTGAAATNIRWVAKVELVEVGYA